MADLPMDSESKFRNNGTFYRGVIWVLGVLFGQKVSFGDGKKFVFKLGQFQKNIFHTWRYSKDSRLFFEIPWTLDIHSEKNLGVWPIH